MAFIHEDGTGVVGANAFIISLFVDGYLADRNRSTENDWNILSDSAKDAAIIAATDYIEKVFQHRYLGRRTSGEQGLGWPRLHVIDRDGFLLASDALPVVLEQATAEYAVRAAALALDPDPTIDASGKTVTRLKEQVGPIVTDTTFANTTTITNLIRAYPAADNLLEPLLVPGQRVLRG